jgi:hypothetical protein
MTTHLFDHPAAPQRSPAAWLASVAVHAGLFAALAYISWRTLGRPASQRPVAEPGIVVGLAGEGEADPVRSESGPAAGEAPPQTGEFGESLVGDASLTLAPGSGDGAPLLAPPPRLPWLNLDGSNAASAATPSSGRRGPLRINELADRATVTVFGAVGEGSRFVYLFDHSTSMAGAPLAAAKQQLLGSLDALTSVHQFQVIFFNHEVHAWDLTGGQQRIPFASDRNKQLAAQFVRSVVASGATDRLTPLRRALAMGPDVVFFLTDADDAMPDYDVADVIERAGRSGAAIACIEFGAGPQPEGENFLTRIASATGGDYVYVDVTTLGAK